MKIPDLEQLVQQVEVEVEKRELCKHCGFKRERHLVHFGGFSIHPICPRRYDDTRTYYESP